MFDITNLMHASFDQQLKMMNADSSNDSILKLKSKKKRPRAFGNGKISSTIKQKLRGHGHKKQDIFDIKPAPCQNDENTTPCEGSSCEFAQEADNVNEDGATMMEEFFAKYGMERIMSLWVGHKIEQNLIENPSLLSATPEPEDSKSIMFNKEKPDLTMDQFISRLVTYSGVEDVVYMFALIYLERIKRKHPMLSLSTSNANRLLATAIPVAAKYVQDFVYPMNFYRKVGGIDTCDEMSRLEVAFLSLIEFDLFVSTEELHAFVTEVKAYVEEKVPHVSSTMSDVINSIMML